MNIGFDAKRAYHNGTGLGHYSRTLISSMAQYFPAHDYYLFNPKPSHEFKLTGPALHEIQPSAFFSRIFSSAWRSNWVKKDLQKNRINLYHGLSHEIPLGLRGTGIASVVTMHDLIHERYPQQYKKIDAKIYTSKFRYACDNADTVIAISEQTKEDLISFYKTPAEKIVVCYQSCNPAFGKTSTAEEKQRVKALYGLPDEFFLCVGSIIERKNLLSICKAVYLLRNKLNIPLVVIGDGKGYKQIVKDYIRQNDLEERIIFLSETEAGRSPGYRSAADFPAIYQSAIAMIYPSFFEGFGIPVMEALWSRLPVITSNVSCLPEAGGDAAYYVDPNSANEIAEGMNLIYNDTLLAEEMKERGWRHAQHFSPEKCATAVMNVYKKLW